MRTVRVVLENSDEELIRALGAGRGTTDIDVRVLRRFGFSGSRLYIVTFGGGLPFVAKIAPRDKYNEERNAVRAAGHFFKDGQNLSHKTTRGSGHGGLLYPHAVADTADHVTASKELRQVVFATREEGFRLPVQFSQPDADVAKILDGVFSLLATARSAATKATLHWSSEYAAYARRDFSDPAIRCILSQRAAEDSFSFLGAEIANPLRVIDQLQREDAKAATFTPIHGDLHPSNVMISDQGECHLVDFAKARKRSHCLKDYALMECSLRFMLFPHHVNLEEQLVVDELLLRRDGGEELEAYSEPSHLAPFYRRLGSSVATIRSAAAGLITSEWDFHEYIATLFLILYGNMGFSVYNRVTATRALGLMGRELRRAGFLQR
jgi:hypothetical protein